MTSYAFDNAWQLARQRLSLLEGSLDPATFRRLSTIGVADGWRCLEIGAGGGSVVEWLCHRVGASGRVVATDLDTRFLDALVESNLSVHRHDVVREELPGGPYDLVHTRLVLMHIPDREQVLPKLIKALKPGGWLLIEEQDSLPITGIPTGPLLNGWLAVRDAINTRGAATEWSRMLPALLASHGLTSVRAEGDVPLFAGGSPEAEFWRLTWEQLRPGLRSAGMADAELDRHLDMFADPAEWHTAPAVIAAWGQRPVVQ